MDDDDLMDETDKETRIDYVEVLDTVVCGQSINIYERQHAGDLTNKHKPPEVAHNSLNLIDDLLENVYMYMIHIL